VKDKRQPQISFLQTKNNGLSPSLELPAFRLDRLKLGITTSTNCKIIQQALHSAKVEKLFLSHSVVRKPSALEYSIIIGGYVHFPPLARFTLIVFTVCNWI
jgi:hypothetical protein